MRAMRIVIFAPCRTQLAGMAQAEEAVAVEAFVAEPPVESLHPAVLHGPARRDAGPLEAAFFLPLQDRAGVNSVSLLLTAMQKSPRISAVRSS